eukprot:scaffold6352_cov200-Isochrysis_galbana.AAC.7
MRVTARCTVPLDPAAPNRRARPVTPSGPSAVHPSGRPEEPPTSCGLGMAGIGGEAAAALRRRSSRIPAKMTTAHVPCAHTEQRPELTEHSRGITQGRGRTRHRRGPAFIP